MLLLGLGLSLSLLAGCAEESLSPTTRRDSNTFQRTPPPDRGSVESDREALVALYNATEGPLWTINDNWLSDRPVGEWHGVETDSTGRVIGLDLAPTG